MAASSAQTAGGRCLAREPRGRSKDRSTRAGRPGGALCGRLPGRRSGLVAFQTYAGPSPTPTVASPAKSGASNRPCARLWAWLFAATPRTQRPRPSLPAWSQPWASCSRGYSARSPLRPIAARSRALLESVCASGNRTVSARTALDEGCSDGRTAGGQLAVGGSWSRVNGLHDWLGPFGEPVSTSWFRDVVGVELSDDLWARARAYESIAQSASWWAPYRRFVLAAERPVVILREPRADEIPHAECSHPLHADFGPAVAWPDGWGVQRKHGLHPVH